MAANGRIEPGQPVSSAISARAWNRAQDAADIVLGVRSDYAAGGAFVAAGGANVVLVRNDSGSAVKPSGILGISGIANATTDAENELPEMARRPVLSGITPTALHSSKVAVALEPIGIGAIGRAAVSGAVSVRVESLSTDHLFADVKSGSALVLKTAEFGPLRILSRTSTGKDGWIWAVGMIDVSSATVRLCKTPSAGFAKGAVSNLSVHEAGTPPNETSSGTIIPNVINKFATINSDKFVSVALHGNGRWYVIAAECS